MRLYLVQHGQAKPKEDDPQRPLSDEGARDVRQVAEFVRPLGLRVRAVWHSGKARAAQTAEAMAAAVTAVEGLLQHPGLAPDDPVDPIRKEIEKLGEDLMLVGHLPFLDRLASRLLVGDESAGVAAFQKGGVVCLQRGPEGDWRLAWMVTPSLLARQ